MKLRHLLFAIAVLLLFGEFSAAAAQTLTQKSDSTNVEAEYWKRRGFLTLGFTDESGIYRVIRVDAKGALRSANFDSLTVDTLATVGTDTIVVDDDFSDGLTIFTTTDVKFRCNKMPSNQWIYIENYRSVSIPIYIERGDTLFFSSATLPEVQVIRGKVK